MPLDDFLPHFDFREIHSRRVAAEPADVLAAARAVTPLEVPLLVALMALRAGPRLGRLSLRRPIVEQFERAGFVQLAANERELVYGGVGRFWTLGGGLTRDPAPTPSPASTRPATPRRSSTSGSSGPRKAGSSS